MRQLILQRMSKSLVRKLIEILLKRINLRRCGEIDCLLKYARFLQHLNMQRNHPNSNDSISKVIRRLILGGKITIAMKLLESNNVCGISINLDEDVSGKYVKQILLDKHPDGDKLCVDVILEHLFLN
ncbi:hypothetical protein GJ496_007959 [Pomphorhynchus laevis]|nr:hypothetical protein GJ496_007959 [Pomphorhynchus laevis]